ncbi:PREDICTED: heat shock factor protein 5-like [Nanorana parkeri]|uniref:heat shock factor protein 5-like n=1 Tax=Nanorana parkeri TaxID=125878 RepID=UPI000854CD5F|nr:PREDICTED: heat shock factor protein 5-like [Nanorana parkeri]
MDVVNPHNFPAKLWRLVNDPHVCSLQWDSRGEGIIIDQELFESELLAPSREINVTDDLFRTTSFGSFIRQLNLYGFRKLVYGSGASCQPTRNLEAGNRNLHPFSNSFFRRGHPELLINLKRLTNINKAKMAAGHKVHTRPPNRYQRLLPNPLEKQRRAETQGLMPLEQIHRYSNQENISLYPYAGPVAQSYNASMNGFGDFPVSAMMWPSSLGPHQGHLGVPSSFPEKPVFFPAMQQFPAVAYTLQSTATSLHVQQSHSFMTEAVHKYGSSPTMQYPNVYHPAGYTVAYSRNVGDSIT